MTEIGPQKRRNVNMIGGGPKGVSNINSEKCSKIVHTEECRPISFSQSNFCQILFLCFLHHHCPSIIASLSTSTQHLVERGVVMVVWQDVLHVHVGSQTYTCTHASGEVYECCIFMLVVRPWSRPPAPQVRGQAVTEGSRAQTAWV